MSEPAPPIPPMPPPESDRPAPATPGQRLERRAVLLMALLVLLLAGSAAYLLYARGAFDASQRLVLVADDSEGVVVGMDLTFSGFPIGRVRRIELGGDGNARILIDVPQRDAHWLRQSSVFTLTRGLVGNTLIRAYSGVLTDPLLPDGAERKVLAGDASAEIPRLVGAAKELVANLGALTRPDGALAATLANLQSASARLNGPQGALGLLLGGGASAPGGGGAIAAGGPSDADRLRALIDRGSAALGHVDGLVRRADGLVGRVDGLVGRADAQVFGEKGLAGDSRAAVQQLQGLLNEARGSLKKVDALLDEAQGVARNARVATVDLGALRSEVEASLRKVEQLVNEVNRRWPLARDTELKLP